MVSFRPLNADEVEVRVAKCTENGCYLLLYKTARADMNLLDETVGSENWQNRYTSVDGKLYCELGIRCDGEWIWKSDTGTESNMEAQKGEASDAFKRAGFRWGIGRELYTAPRIYVGSDSCNMKQRNNGTWYCSDRFAVTCFEVSDGRITSLQIANTSRKGAVVFGSKARRPDDRADASKKAKAPATDDLKAAKAELNTAIKAYCERHGADYRKTVEGMQSRPEWESQKDSADYLRAVADEFATT